MGLQIDLLLAIVIPYAAVLVLLHILLYAGLSIGWRLGARMRRAHPMALAPKGIEFRLKTMALTAIVVGASFAYFANTSGIVVEFIGVLYFRVAIFGALTALAAGCVMGVALSLLSKRERLDDKTTGGA